MTTIDALWVSNPSESGECWFVWNAAEPLPPKIVFTGTMEQAGLVADALNAHRERGEG